MVHRTCHFLTLTLIGVQKCIVNSLIMLCQGKWFRIVEDKVDLSDLSFESKEEINEYNFITTLQWYERLLERSTSLFISHKTELISAE